MHIYYLDEPLSDTDLADVAEMLEVEVEQVRIPNLLPARGVGTKLEVDLEAVEDASIGLLKAAGILRDYGCRVGLVTPRDMVSYGGLAEAMFTLTGYYPYSILTARHREAIGNPGYQRITDMYGMMTEP